MLATKEKEMFKSRIRATFVAIMLAVPIQGFSQPSAGIKALIQTPASAFDVFLNQLYIKLNGPTHFGKSHLSEGLHVFQLEYDAVSNVIHIGLHLGPENSLIPAFSKLDENGKRDTLVSAAKSIARSLGLTAEGSPLPIRYGLIQQIKIRNGWGDENVEDSLKNEIADRTSLKVVYAFEDKVAYIAERSPDGKYMYSTVKK